MKKGFTLVEIAVVLVIIGLIAGMAIKGKSLIKAAQVRAFLVTIARFEAATMVLLAQNEGTMPAKYINPAVSPTIKDSALLSTGVVSEKDYISRFSRIDYTGVQYVLLVMLCDDNGNRNLSRTSAAGYCFGPNITPEGICYMEIMLDDQSTTSGRAKWHNNVQTNTINFNDCDKNPNTGDWRSGGPTRNYSVRY